MTDPDTKPEPAPAATGHVDEPASGAGYGDHAEEPDEPEPLDAGLNGGAASRPGSDQR